MILSLLQSTVVGIVLGAIYGLSFLKHKRRVLSACTSKRSTTTGYRFLTIMFALFRLGLFAMLLFFVLHSKTNQIILTLSCFIIVFWLTILKGKATLYEGH